ncbi:hypothetical protein OGAPHI_004236 [Ogataea philodendri]|uniref:Uncharacterized protein n=1 Tax=Ogataea philodendri TaxID=1378263 RepID=A0A9P8P6A4_9ASCO|nr:uncharacterized protein OGAPHI_004236 [Ogataea philodendri]KAH3666047.1 hypothetical protein OGAPHI_004236 [Ogataea philodendri]
MVDSNRESEVQLKSGSRMCVHQSNSCRNIHLFENIRVAPICLCSIKIDELSCVHKRMNLEIGLARQKWHPVEQTESKSTECVSSNAQTHLFGPDSGVPESANVIRAS